MEPYAKEQRFASYPRRDRAAGKEKGAYNTRKVICESFIQQL